MTKTIETADIVERLRKEIAGYTDAPIEKAESDMREAADEIEQLREDMVEIMYLLTQGRDSAQQIMDIVKPWAIQQIAFTKQRAALKESE